MVRELAHLTSKAEPTPFHHMLASLAKEGRLMRLYSQNIDSIDTHMLPLATNVPLNIKGPWPTTIQLHGGLEKMVCTKCNHLEPFNASLFEGPEPPLCQKCKEQDEVRTSFAGKRSHGIGRLRPRIVLYNEYNPDEEAIGNVSKADLRRVPDAVIVVGTTLKIPGVRRLVKEMCQLTRSRRDGVTAWINLEGEPQGVDFKDCWDFVVKGKCDDVAELVNLPRWDQQELGERDSYMVTGDQQKEERYDDVVKNRENVIVQVEIKRKSTPDTELGSSQEEKRGPGPADQKSRLVDQLQGGIPTPSASPRLQSPVPTGKAKAKAPTKGKGKQSMLIFAQGTSAQEDPVPPVPAATRTRLPAARGRPRKVKKEESKPLNTLNQAFKATKMVASAGKDAAKKVSALAIRSADSPAALPSLRPTIDSLAGKRKREEPPYHTLKSSPPPVLQNKTQPTTISPGSKPRSMNHLID